jgi:hypothetical protein
MLFISRAGVPTAEDFAPDPDSLTPFSSCSRVPRVDSNYSNQLRTQLQLALERVYMYALSTGTWARH